MNHSKKPLNALLLAAALALPCAAWADDAAPREEQGPGVGGPPPPPPPFMRGGPQSGPQDDAPPFLRGLELNEAQQDKVFAVLHAQAPLLRDQHKIAAKAHRELRELGMSGKFDDAKAVALAQSEAQALARINLQQARSEQQILASLSLEQRKQIEQRFQDGPRHPPRPQ